MERDLMDDDGENRAVRAFLQLYGGNASVTLVQMKEHLRASGFDGCWPRWVEGDIYGGHLTKCGAQDWLRYLFSLEFSMEETQQQRDAQKQALAQTITVADLLDLLDNRYPDDRGGVIAGAICKQYGIKE